MKKTLLVTCMAALLAAPAVAQVDFTRYVALGDSLTAGFVGGGLMDYYQYRSYPALLARQGGTGTFEMPLIAPPGLGPVLELKSLAPLAIGPTDLPPPADPFEYFYNVTLEAPYQNLGIPGSNTYDMLFTTGNIFNLIGGNEDNVMHDLILRTPTVEDPSSGNQIDYTALVAAISQSPTFATVWIGNYDFLGAVVAATPIDGVTMTPITAFEQYYTQAIGALATSLPNSQIVLVEVIAELLVDLLLGHETLAGRELLDLRNESLARLCLHSQSPFTTRSPPLDSDCSREAMDCSLPRFSS